MLIQAVDVRRVQQGDAGIEDGPEHRKIFTVEVSVHGEFLGSGVGPSKQEAERNAARAALAELQAAKPEDASEVQ